MHGGEGLMPPCKHTDKISSTLHQESTLACTTPCVYHECVYINVVLVVHVKQIIHIWYHYGTLHISSDLLNYKINFEHAGIPVLCPGHTTV